MDSAERQLLIATYVEGPSLVANAVQGLSDWELDRRPADGSWTARMVVHHLADSETMSAIRLRRLVAEDNPLIIGYDEELWSKMVYYNRPIAGSLAAMRNAREMSAEILACLSEDEWKRSGTHNESGHYGIETWLEIYAAHGRDHANQILQVLGRR